MIWPDAEDAARAAEADAAATVRSTISRMPCPSKSGWSSAWYSSVRSNENVIPPASVPASTVSRSERCQLTRTSCGVPAPRSTVRTSSSGSSEANASSISSRAIVTVAASGRPPAPVGVSIAVALNPVPSMEGLPSSVAPHRERAALPTRRSTAVRSSRPRHDCFMLAAPRLGGRPGGDAPSHLGEPVRAVLDVPPALDPQGRAGRLLAGILPSSGRHVQP